MAQTQSKNKTKVSTIITGILLIFIPVCMGLLVCIPAFGQWVISSKTQIFEGLILGVSLLPILLFITIKGGWNWYKLWWTWTILALAIITLVVIVILGKGQTGSDMQGVPPVTEPGTQQGVSVEGMGKG